MTGCQGGNKGDREVLQEGSKGGRKARVKVGGYRSDIRAGYGGKGVWEARLQGGI